ncbi:MAG: AMP-binding protein [Hyphomicrobiaceae bacterium]|nr:MAG: AMP-binding protein [Hyphomicrobiaceae bacterium]
MERDVPARFLAIVRDLVWELHPHLRRSTPVGLDSDFDRDLALDSLGRAELILRLDKAFKVRLPDHLLSEAGTPRDLLAAVLAARPDRRAMLEGVAAAAVALPEIAAPATAETVIDVLEHHVSAHGDRPHLRVWHGEGVESCLTYRDLRRECARIAAGLLDHGLAAGDRVAIMLPTDATFFEAFFGVLYAGGIPVPVYPPFRRAQVEEHLRRQAGILRNAEAAFLVVAPELRNVGSLLVGLTEHLRRVATVAGLRRAGSIDHPVPAGPQTVALMQYTSGSTGDPKGVVLTHANLLANIRAMGEVLEAGSSDVFVSWLPLYHDMGLIGAWLGSLYYGALAIIMPPLAFLADPARWLRAIGQYRATLSAAPNFAFELCCRNVRDEDVRGLDLSSLKMIVNGAEPVSPSTIARFTERFAQYGFRPQMMGPVYGLAENSVGLAFPPLGRAPIVDRIGRLALSRDGVAMPAPPGDRTALEFVACGVPIPRHEVRIVDESGREVAERTEGRLQFKGPSATAGYFRNDEKNRALFDGEWLETGDRAYVASGDIYITGRIKDMIIKAGRHIYPHEIEELVGGIEGVRKGCVVAFPTMGADRGTERLVVLAETRIVDEAARQALKQKIAETCTTVLEVPPDDVELVAPRTVPKTSSGKIRRSAARALYESGLPTQRERSLWWQVAWLTMSGLGNRMRRARRWLIEAIYAGYWWILLVMTACLVWPTVVALPRLEWRYRLIRMAGHAFLRATGAPPRVDAEAEIPSTGIMIVANHASYLDSLVIATVIPGPLSFVAKEELARQWIAGPFLRRIATLFVRRIDPRGGVEDTQRQLEAARAGARIVSFPEGTLTRRPGLLGFRLGAFLVAAQAGVPVLPVTVRGTRSILRGGQWFPRRGEIVVHIGKAMLAQGGDFAAAVQLRDQVRAAMLEHYGEPDLARERISLDGM